MTHTRKRPAHRILLAAGLGLVLLAAACGSDDNDTASNADDPESAYCDAAREFAIYVLDGTGDDFAEDPVAFKKYWGVYVAFLEDGLRLSPDAIRDDWKTFSEVPRVKLTAIFEKYDYNLARMEAEGSDAEKSATEPNEEQGAAQDAVHAYESLVCGTEEPPAAAVSFEGAEKNEAYCEAWMALNESFAEGVVAHAFSQESFRTFMTSDALLPLLDAVDENAPEEIKADVLAENEWTRTRWTDVAEKYDYDIRKLILDGPAADLAVFNRTDPATVEHARRNTAYQEQLCES